LDSIVYSVKLVYDAFVFASGTTSGTLSQPGLMVLRFSAVHCRTSEQIAKAVFTGNFSDARVLFDGMLQHLKDNFEGFKSGLMGIGDG
jgi:hypothetical protein